MSEMMEILDREYQKYVAERVGEKKANDTAFSRFNHYSEACGVASNLHKNYDVGVALATDGLWLGYIASTFGFPVIDVKLGRRGNGATWQPIDEIAEEDLRDKRVIVFDNDALTGRTLRSAAREIESFSPSLMDLLLVYEKTPITSRMYMNGRVPQGLPSPTEIYESIWSENGSDNIIQGWQPNEEGLRIDYLKYGRYSESFTLRPTDWITMLNTRTNVPESFGKIKTLEKDFQPDYEAVKRFEAKVRGQVNE